MRRHPEFPDWLVDDRRHVWKRERVFTCPNHPYGPDHEDDDEFSPCQEFARKIIASRVVHGYPNLAEAAKVELCLCCKGHRWRNTGRLLEVGAFEALARSMLTGPIAQSLTGSILLAEIERGTKLPRTAAGEAARVRIPLILHHTPPTWFCNCEGPDGMIAHPIDERSCTGCGADAPKRVPD